MEPQPISEPAKDIVFYDGTCGLCHHWVRWVLAHDPESVFRFAPLQSEVFQNTIPEVRRATLPDTVVIGSSNGHLLTRSAAALYVIDRLELGGFWRAIATIARLVPTGIRDFFYDAIAKARYRLFGRRQEMCPILPPHLRERFLV